MLRLSDRPGLGISLNRSVLERYRLAWRHAAERTPHGTPIELAAEDFAEQTPKAGAQLGFAP